MVLAFRVVITTMRHSGLDTWCTNSTFVLARMLHAMAEGSAGFAMGSVASRFQSGSERKPNTNM